MTKLSLKKKNIESADEVRKFSKGRMEVVSIGNLTIGRGTFEPGWKWSECVRPIAGGESCQAPHTNYVLSGRMHILMDDGTQAEVGPGDIITIPPGHDAWTVGNEPCIVLDITGAKDYAKK